MNTEKKSDQEYLDTVAFNDKLLSDLVYFKEIVDNCLKEINSKNLVFSSNDFISNELMSFKNSQIPGKVIRLAILIKLVKTIGEIKKIVPKYKSSSEKIITNLTAAREFIPEARKMLDEAEQILNDVCLD